MNKDQAENEFVMGEYEREIKSLRDRLAKADKVVEAAKKITGSDQPTIDIRIEDLQNAIKLYTYEASSKEGAD